MNDVWGLARQFTIAYMINPDASSFDGKTGFISFGIGPLAAIGGYFLFPQTKVRSIGRYVLARDVCFRILS